MDHFPLLAVTENILAGGGWAAISAISVAIIAFLGARYIVMEKQIRKLTDYTWLKNEQSEQRMSYLEDRIDADEDYIDALELKVMTGEGPPLPIRRRVRKSPLAAAQITPDASAEELKTAIRKVVDSPEGPSTGPIHTI